ncbi:MAG TPA: hypothetical protein VL404_06090 [Candidatus Eisenbacteria bacterium]|jgi:hypothetical protein|nr:hypothetical protein [Candidatus Eisenbacteria bacterium]
MRRNSGLFLGIAMLLLPGSGGAGEEFRLSCPAGWTREEAPGVTAAFLSPRRAYANLFDENVNLVVRDLEGEPDLDGYTARAVKEIVSSVPAARLLEKGPAVVDGRPAARVVFTGRLGSLPMKWCQIWTLNEGKSYVFTYSALEPDYARSLAGALAVVESFQFTQRSPNPGESG